jgi:drug/metabolite transporter (DMT)-like permease
MVVHLTAERYNAIVSLNQSRLREGRTLNRIHPRMSGKPGARLALAVAMVGTAFSAVLNKFALNEGLHPIWINAFRLGFTVLIMLAYALVRRRSVPIKIPRSEFLLSLASGALLAAHFVCWVYALKLTDALAATAIWSTYLFFTALGSMFFLKEKIPGPAFGAMGLAFLGVLVVNIGWSEVRISGNLSALGAAVAQAGYFLCGRRVRKNTDTFSYTFVVYAAAFSLLLASALFMRLPFDGMTPHALSAALGLTVFCTLLGHTLCSYALKSLSAITVSIGMLTEVVTGPLVVFLLLREAPGRFTLIGGIVILISVAWYFLIDWRRTRSAENPAQDAL